MKNKPSLVAETKFRPEVAPVPDKGRGGPLLDRERVYQGQMQSPGMRRFPRHHSGPAADSEETISLAAHPDQGLGLLCRLGLLGHC
jgi:hypothetical protein